MIKERMKAELPDLERVQAELSNWQPLDQFAETLLATLEEIPSEVLFNRSGLTFLREAWVALQLARVLRASAICVSGDRFPDAYIRVNDIECGLEIAEVLEEDRRRGAEDWKAISYDPESEWRARADQIPEQLRSVVHKKCMKGYPRTVSLLIYLNIHEWGIAQKEIETILHDCTQEAGERFLQVWVFWKEKFYLLWDNGRRSERVLTSEYWKAGFEEE